jgi:hypothetical protein
MKGTMFEPDSLNYYEVLDIKPDAGQNEIRQAYFRAKAAYGKDSAAVYSLFDEQETRHVLDKIEQAYLVLSNPEKRREYDKVHGFLRSGDSLPATKKPPQQSNVFSFARSSESADPAQAAAHAVFGSGTSGTDAFPQNHAPDPFSGEPAAHAENAEAAPAASAPPQPSREIRHEDYSTPRTLAAHGAAGPPVQEYSSSSLTFTTNENRLGIVRRIDLAKPYDKSPAMEEEISRETTFRGDFFRKVREYKGITIDELSEFTKISRTYINCIESEEFESLPAPAYLRGFIAQIAKTLKLPHDKAASAYMSHYKATVLK